MSQKYPKNYQILYGLANTEHNQGKNIIAADLYKKVGEIEPKFGKVHEMLAFIALNKIDIPNMT